MGALAGPSSAIPQYKLMQPGPWNGRLIISVEDFDPGRVGQKAVNVKKMHSLPAMKPPGGVAAPYLCMQQVLELPANRDVKVKLADAIAGITEANVVAMLKRCRHYIGLVRIKFGV